MDRLRLRSNLRGLARELRPRRPYSSKPYITDVQIRLCIRAREAITGSPGNLGNPGNPLCAGLTMSGHSP
jgi:hypothetical protein